MIFKQVTWRSWAAIGVLLGLYTGLYFWIGTSPAVEAWMYRTGLLAATIAPLVLIAVYTAAGNRWWANDISAALVQTALCMVPIAGPLAWVFWMGNGSLTSSLLAWIEVSGPALSALALLRLSWVFLRVSRSKRKG